MKGPNEQGDKICGIGDEEIEAGFKDSKAGHENKEPPKRPGASDGEGRGCPFHLRCWRRTRALSVPSVLAVVLSLVAGGWTQAASATVPVLGFQSEGSPTSRIGRDAPALGSVGVDGLNLTGAPGMVSSPGLAARRQLSAAHAAGLPAMLLVGNFSEKLGDFSEPLAWRTLRSSTAIARLARRLAGFARAEGWDGISVDLESLRGRDRGGLIDLLADLRADLGAGASLTIAVENVTSVAGYPARGYDLPAAARLVDQVVLMAYDQHGPWEKAPGPVGSDAWVRAGLRAVLAQVPAAQVDLGVAGYGYVWGSHRRQVPAAAARALASRAGARARWVAPVGEWTADLPGGAVVWWSGSRTLARRERLATSLGLHGVAVWSLGLSETLR